MSASLFDKLLIYRFRCRLNICLLPLALVRGFFLSSLSSAYPQDYCRNDPKVFRGILRVIALQKTAEKMIALYQKYKESGLTCDEILKKTAKPNPADAPIDLAFVDQFYDRRNQLDDTKLSPDQKVALNLTLVKLRGMAYQKMKLLK